MTSEPLKFEHCIWDQLFEQNGRSLFCGERLDDNQHSIVKCGCVKPFILRTFFVLQDNHDTKVHDHQATTTMDLHTFLNLGVITVNLHHRNVVESSIDVTTMDFESQL